MAIRSRLRDTWRVASARLGILDGLHALYLVVGLATAAVAGKLVLARRPR